MRETKTQLWPPPASSTKTPFFSLAGCLHYPMMSFQCKHFDNEIELQNFSSSPRNQYSILKPMYFLLSCKLHGGGCVLLEISVCVFLFFFFFFAQDFFSCDRAGTAPADESSSTAFGVYSPTGLTDVERGVSKVDTGGKVQQRQR